MKRKSIITGIIQRLTEKTEHIIKYAVRESVAIDRHKTFKKKKKNLCLDDI